MNAGFHFLPHEQFSALSTADKIEYLDRAVFELDRLNGKVEQAGAHEDPQPSSRMPAGELEPT